MSENNALQSGVATTASTTNPSTSFGNNTNNSNSGSSSMSGVTTNNSSSTNNNVSSNVSNSLSLEDDKKKKKKEELNITVLNEPKRKIPKVIEEALDNKIPVILAKNGYFLGGFYGLNHDNQHEGFAFAQETTEENTLVFYDSKGHKHLVKSFEDLVKFHNHVWGLFFKLSDAYKKPDILWFGFMLQYGVLSITPGNSK